MHSVRSETHRSPLDSAECKWARLQGFPDDFKWDLADTHMYKQFGNSVTVNVIEAIAQKIKEVLDESEEEKHETVGQ